MADTPLGLLVRAPQFADPVEAYGRALTLRGLAGQGQLQDLQLEQARQAQAEDAALRGVYSRMAPGTTLADLLPDIYRASPRAGMATQKSLLEQSKGQAELEKISEEVKAARAKAARDSLVSVSDQASWDAWRAQRSPQEQGIVPAVFSPEAKDRFLATADKFLERQRPSDLGRLIQERDALPSNSPVRKVYDAAIEKASTHQGPLVQMGLGSPVPVQTPDGGTVLVQPPTKPGGRAEIVTVPGLGAVSPAVKPRESTDSERMAAGYGDRMIAAESIIERQGSAGLPSVPTQVAGAVPLVGRYAQSRAMTPEQQMFRQAQEDWVRAKLRKESGAVISPQEMRDEISTYFPQPGDVPETVKQKAQARKIATEAMLRAAGGRAAPGAATGDVIDFNSLPKAR